MSNKVYIAMHKIIKLPNLDSLYTPLLVGSYKYSSDLDVVRDDFQINISNKNDSYCELTGLYWIWKNCTYDYVGLCHYRRFLTKRFSFLNDRNLYLTDNDIEEDKRSGIEIILPEKHYFKNKIVSNSSTAPNMADMKIVEEILKEKYPEYLNDYLRYINGNSSYLCNVMIAKKQIFDEYCEWLFNILFEAERRIDVNTYVNDPYRKRLFGFISERLLNVWVIHNEKRFLIKKYPLVNSQDTIVNRIKYCITQNINRLIYRGKNEII